jgi:hypothetical protein
MTVKTIEPTTIEEAESDAKRLMQEAYGLHDVPQADGSSVQLCYAGRLHRAYQMRSAALLAGDASKAQRLTSGIENLLRTAEKAQKAAEDADVLYQGMCATKGIEAANTTPPDCECAGCTDKNKGWRMAAAAGNVRKAAWSFLGDVEGNGEPPFIGLFRKASQDKKANDLLWRHWLQIADSMQVYMDECSKAGEKPDWRKELWS